MIILVAIKRLSQASSIKLVLIVFRMIVRKVPNEGNLGNLILKKRIGNA